MTQMDTDERKALWLGWFGVYLCESVHSADENGFWLFFVASCLRARQNSI